MTREEQLALDWANGKVDIPTMLRDYAHMLADDIRALDPVEGALAGQHAYNDAADLIDPYAAP